MQRIALYLLAGLAAYVGLRYAFKKLKFDARPHDRIWGVWYRDSPAYLPEAWVLWIFSILIWPIYVVVSLCWLGAEVFHATGKKELKCRAEIEAARNKTYDHLSLEQKLALLATQARNADQVSKPPPPSDRD